LKIARTEGTGWPLRFDVSPIIDEMRLIKSPKEIALLRMSGEITAAAHRQVMLSCKPGMRECELAGLIKAKFLSSGAFHSAYSEIIARSGLDGNANILHYTANRDLLRDGDLALVDAGCWLEGYAGDVTMTFPVNGKFTENQRRLYEIVLKAQNAGRRAAKVGRPFHDVHLAAQRVLRAGLVDLGILPQACRTRRSEQAMHRQAVLDGRPHLVLQDITLHYVGHFLGIDVHDVGDEMPHCGKLKGRPEAHPGIDLTLHPSRCLRVLEEGMCLTIGPGLYFRHGDRRVPEWCWGICIRLEDDYFVTKCGAKQLNPSLPRTVEEIESFMASARK
jgi:Xaa-Pro aminopeptidase